MLLGIDSSTWMAVSAIAVSAITGAWAYLSARGKNKNEASASTIQSAIDLINELQQERDGIRDVYMADLRRCNHRIGHLEGKMSTMVIYIRRVEAFLRSRRLFDKAPQFDWQTFYKSPNGNGA